MGAFKRSSCFHVKVSLLKIVASVNMERYQNGEYERQAATWICLTTIFSIFILSLVPLRLLASI